MRNNGRSTQDRIQSLISRNAMTLSDISNHFEISEKTARTYLGAIHSRLDSSGSHSFTVVEDSTTGQRWYRIVNSNRSSNSMRVQGINFRHNPNRTFSSAGYSTLVFTR